MPSPTWSDPSPMSMPARPRQSLPRRLRLPHPRQQRHRRLPRKRRLQRPPRGRAGGGEVAEAQEEEADEGDHDGELGGRLELPQHRLAAPEDRPVRPEVDRPAARTGVNASSVHFPVFFISPTPFDSNFGGPEKCSEYSGITAYLDATGFHFSGNPAQKSGSPAIPLFRCPAFSAQQGLICQFPSKGR